MKRRLVTSALPYVNNVPHLGNLIQVLSADAFARWCRLYGYETLYICGTDEYGTATETRALEEGVSPQELCDRYYAIHRDIYAWFEIAFDHFGRTSRPIHTEITQGLYRDLDRAGYLIELESQQIYCPDRDMFLADRYVRGTCPRCGYKEARGDQCENCGALLDPVDLIDPYSPVCPGKLTVKSTRHLYIDLPAIRPRLEEWLRKASVEGFWSANALKMTEAWIRDGLKPRAITRDLRWGIPVPRPGYEKKVFYVWFDAPIGYISITADLTPQWRDWWQNPDGVELFQFIGKDNIPFHTVVFPSTLLGAEAGSGIRWTKLHHMSATEYLNYEGGKFSKSAGVGVFGTDARETGIPADVWRFYLFYNRPETSDTLFAWKDFAEKVNAELIGNFANLVNRALTFANRHFYDFGDVEEETSWKELCASYRERVRDHFEHAQLREALKVLLEWSDRGNKRFQAAEPWKTIQTNPQGVQRLVKELCGLVRDLGVLLWPFLPATSERILGWFGYQGSPRWGWMDCPPPFPRSPEILFQRMEANQVEQWRRQFSGQTKAASPEQVFAEKVLLVAARIVQVEKHPNAEKLFIERLDVGALGQRTIVSGLAGHYTPDELLNKTIVLLANLKPARLRGVESQGMLLAASQAERLEVLTVDAPPGTLILPQGQPPRPLEEYSTISVDDFFSVPLKVRGGKVFCGSTPLQAVGKDLQTTWVLEGDVG